MALWVLVAIAVSGFFFGGGGVVAIQYVEPHARLECGASVCFEF